MTPRVLSWTADRSLVWTRYPDSDEWVVYHPVAGTVHCVTDSAHQLWEAACDHPRTTADLIALFEPQFDRESRTELEAVLHETLTSMDRAGLLQAAV